MKKYLFEATKRQWEKPTEPKQYLCAAAAVTVCAENADEAKALAEKKLCRAYKGSGTVLGQVRLVEEYDLPVSWDGGAPADVAAANIIR